MNKAVFIDRDGTLVKDVHYCRRPEDCNLLPTVGDGLHLLSRQEFKIIVITNQSGIARGYLTEEILGTIHAKLKSDVEKYGARVDAIYHCPHHPDDKCACRKPNTGLLDQALKDWNIDIKESYFIGDKILDVEAANRVGCKAILVPNSEPEIRLLKNQDNFPGKIDFLGTDFLSAASWVINDVIQNQIGGKISQRFKGIIK
jgi:histidinol-phosphate phosphatase family protein